MVPLKDNVALVRAYAARHSHARYSLLCALLSSSFVCRSQKHSIKNDQVKPLENLHLVITEILECIIDQIYVINNYYYQVNLMITTLHLRCKNPVCAWFFEIAFVQKVGMRICVFVSPQAIKNHSRELKSE